MKIGDEVYIHGYVDEIRKDVVIIRNDGGYFGTVPSEIKDDLRPVQEVIDILENELDLSIYADTAVKNSISRIKAKDN